MPKVKKSKIPVASVAFQTPAGLGERRSRRIPPLPSPGPNMRNGEATPESSLTPTTSDPPDLPDIAGRPLQQGRDSNRASFFLFSFAHICCNAG